MPDTYTLPGEAREQSALEARADVESLEELLHQRRVIVEQIAPLAAMFGNFGMFDARRQQMGRAAIIRAKLRMDANNQKYTEKVLEAEGLTDPDYVRFLDECEQRKIDFLLYQNALDDIADRIKNRELSLRAYAVEAGLR